MTALSIAPLWWGAKGHPTLRRWVRDAAAELGGPADRLRRGRPTDNIHRPRAERYYSVRHLDVERQSAAITRAIGNSCAA